MGKFGEKVLTVSLLHCIPCWNERCTSEPCELTDPCVSFQAAISFVNWDKKCQRRYLIQVERCFINGLLGATFCTSIRYVPHGYFHKYIELLFRWTIWNHRYVLTSVLSSTLLEIDPDTAYVVCISVSLGFPYMVSIFHCFLIWYQYALISLYGNTTHCSACVVAMGCYELSIVPRTAIVTSQWYDRYYFAEYARTWARHPTTPWQRECTTITDFQSIDSL